jgi:hypothetical protein
VFLEESPWLRPEQSTAAAESPAEIEPLETDRDSFTPATTVVGLRRVIVENSYSFLDNRRTPDSHSFPEMLTRIGITRRTELRLGWNYEVGGGGTVSGTELGDEDEFVKSQTEAQLLIGFKTAMTEQDEWLPESALIMHVTTPTAGVETATQMTAGYVVGWKLPSDWKLDAALRYGTASEHGDRFSNWAPSVVLRVPIEDRWNVHAEYFGILTQDKAEAVNVHYFSPGVHYLLTPDCEIGVRIGWGLSEASSQFFSNVGLGVRF